MAAPLLVSSPAAAASTICTVGGIVYTVDSVHVAAGATARDYTGAGGVVNIPDFVTCGTTSYPVTMIGGVAFASNGVTAVTIPDSVTYIGDLAFYDNQLTSVTIPDSVTALGEKAFYGNQLTSVTIPRSITSLKTSVFAENKLQSVTIPDSVTSIGSSAFQGNELTSVTIPDSVTALGEKAFYDNQLTSVTIPRSITSLETTVFATNKLESVTIPDSVTSIGDFAFYGNQLSSVTIPDSVTTIGKEAFAFNQLTSVTIPRSITSLEEAVFGHNKLVSVTIPDSVTSIGNYAFQGNRLASVTLPNSIKSIKEGAFNLNQLTSVTIPRSVTSIGEYAFYANTLLKSVTFEGAAPTAITPAGSSSASLGTTTGLVVRYYAAFDDANTSPTPGFTTPTWQNYTTQIAPEPTTCTIDDVVYMVDPANVSAGATARDYTGAGGAVDIPDSVTCGSTSYPVTTIGRSAFYDNQVTSVTIPDSVTSIEVHAFERNQLTSVTIPDSVTTILDSAFTSNQLTSIAIPDSVTYFGRGTFSNNQLTSVTIPDSVTAIDDGAFNNNRLTSVTIPDSVTQIGDAAFSGNLGLVNVTFEGAAPTIITPAGSSTPSLGNATGLVVRYHAAFDDTKTSPTPGFTTPTWKGYVTQLVEPTTCTVDSIVYVVNPVDVAAGATARDYTGAGGAVDIPDSITCGTEYSVTSIGDSAFFALYFTNLLTSVTIPDSVTSIGNYAFGYNLLKSIAVPDSVTSIGDSAFIANQASSVSIADSVTDIGRGAFAYNALSSVSIPGSVTSIGDFAFGGNTNLVSVTFDGAAPTTITPAGSSPSLGNATGLVVHYNAAFDDAITSPTPGFTTPTWKGYTTQSFEPTTCAIGQIVYTVDPADVTAGATASDFTGTGGGAAIPSSITCGTRSYPVTAIGDYAFAYNELTSVTIPSSVTSIGDSAFFYDGLTSVNIPSSVTSIGRSAFAQNVLRSVVIPDSITTIRANTFASNKLLTVVTIPDSVTTIESGAFMDNNLGSVTIPDSVTSIGRSAFENNRLTSVTIPGSVTQIGDAAFSNFRLVSVTFEGAAPTSITPAGSSSASLGTASGLVVHYDAAFDDANTSPTPGFTTPTWKGYTTQAVQPTTCTVGKIVYKVDPAAVAAGATASDYTGTGGAVDVPGSVTCGTQSYPVTTIGEGAFLSNGLTSVTISDSVTTIGSAAFGDNTGLVSVTFKGAAPTTITPAGTSSPSLGAASGLVVRYKEAFDDANTSPTPGFTSPTWQGYDTQVIPTPVAPMVTTNPSDTTVNPGDTATFTAAASGVPAPTVRWQVNTGDGTGFSDIPGSAGSSATLTLTGVTAAMTGNTYRARFENDLGDETTTAATLTVNSAPSLTGETAASGKVGDPFTYSYIAGGTPAPTVTITGGTLPAGVVFDPATETISGTPARGTAGSYQVVLTAHNGIGGDATLRVALTFAPDTVDNLAPTISGLAQVGRVLTAEAGPQLDPSDAQLKYTWSADGARILWATRKTFTPTRAQAGKRITVTITASSPTFGSSTATSDPTAVVRLKVYGDHLTLDRNTVARGGDLGLTGQGLNPGEVYQITIGRIAVGTATADEYGEIIRTITVPTTVPVGWQVVRITAPDGNVASAAIRITS